MNAHFRTQVCGAALILALAASPARAFSSEAAAAASTEASNDSDFLVSSTPPGFDDLAQPRETLVDIYYAGKKVGEAVAVARPGFVQFRDPHAVALLVPNVTSVDGLAGALTGDLPTHADLVCGEMNARQCGKLDSGFPAVIFDESRFRVELFVPKTMLQQVAVTQQRFLEAPSSAPSLTSAVGVSISGSADQRTTYNIQDRTVVAMGPARVVSDFSYASEQGLIVDDLVGELDRGQLRYSAGLFWAPGLDITGRRRIAGVGFGTQFDTRVGRDALRGTPLILFLSRPARVEFLIDGRLVTSRSYDAGNDILDTSGLPDGSYPLVLRITEADGTSREERRFFVKAPQIAPAGQPLYFGYVGMLANTRFDRPISLSDDLYFQLGTARRLTGALAVDLSVVGTQHKQMLEAGAWLLNSVGQFRAAGLISSAGDAAAVLQGSSNGRSRINFSFDLRRVWSADGRPLIPAPTFINSFAGSGIPEPQIVGSYTQASGSIGYRIGSAYLSVIGSLRKDEGSRSDYSIGPSLTWAFLNRHGFQVTLQADGQRTRNTTAAFGGIRFVYTGRHVSVVGNAGAGSTSSRDHSAPTQTRVLGGLSANYLYQDNNRTEASVGAGIDRGINATVAHAGGTLYSRFGNVRADVLDDLDDLEARGGPQYGLSLQSALAITGGSVGLGSRDLEDSAVIVTVDGSADGATFDVMVNGMTYGHIRSGEQLPVHLQPYRAYEVRMRPRDAAAVTLENDTQQVTLYPGTVRLIRATAQAYFTAFGQAVGVDGRPIANAMLQAPRSIGETDENGYFQIDVANGDRIKLSHGADSCAFELRGGEASKDFVPVGKVVCK